MGKSNTRSKISQLAPANGPSAGIDVGKARLDIAVHNRAGSWTVENNAEGWRALIERLRELKVVRVGMEATGGYERGVASALHAAGFEVILHQPAQMRAFAKAWLQRAKSDSIDAMLIAAFTALLGGRAFGPDPRLEALRDALVHLEQIETDEARNKTRLEHCKDTRVRRLIQADIMRCRRQSLSEEKRLRDAIKRHLDLAERLELLISIPGIGQRTALSLIIFLPELGSLTREQVSALVGLAPFVCESGDRHGERHIAGGRARVRKALYSAAVPAATQWNPTLKLVYERLIGAGKCKKSALVACARKLLIYANTILARGSKWTTKPT